MTTTPTKSNIESEGYRVWKAKELDKEGEEVTVWYFKMDYLVNTEEGEVWRQNVSEELTDTTKTQAIALFDELRSRGLTKEGL